jgi:tetratricopeptide (TPR) repeat protein
MRPRLPCSILKSMTRTAGLPSQVERIPLGERDAYPRVAVFEAARHLEDRPEEWNVEALDGHYAAVMAYLDTQEGRRLPGIHALLSRLAAERGDETLALAHSDADARERRHRASSQLTNAAIALEAGRLEEAAEELRNAQRLTPNDTKVLQIAARLAAARGDSEHLSEALWKLRSWAPSLSEGVGRENSMRAQLELPMLPDRAPARLEPADSQIVLPH